jgi:hypothetical protein
MGTVESFVHLFRGRGDAYGSWSGGCVREQLTPDHFRRHLYSHYERDWIGVYNVIGDDCSWGCVDIDVPDLPTMTRVRIALARETIPSWIEQTTRGYHLWCFPAAQLVPATTMRQALTAACLRVGYQPKEVFPKQVSASGTKLGNYVRLPLNGGLAQPTAVGCRRFIANGVTLEDMDRNRAASVHLERLAAEIPPPQAVDVTVDMEAGLEVEPIVAEIGGRVQRVWRDGPAWGADRSSTLAHLAHLLRERDIDPTTAFAIVASADDRWGKGFRDRGSAGVEILLKLVRNAYAEAS